MRRTIALGLCAALTLPGLARSQTDHSQMDHSATEPAATQAGEGDARSAFQAANARMHEEMDVELTGDADIDFARAMIPHHRGAVDMARIVIEHGEDAELRALAQEIVETQSAEIAQLEAWLAANGDAPAQ